MDKSANVVRNRGYSSNNQELMKNVYIQGTCAPDSVLGFKVFTLHSLCAQFQGDYLIVKFFGF